MSRLIWQIETCQLFNVDLTKKIRPFLEEFCAMVQFKIDEILHFTLQFEELFT